MKKIAEMILASGALAVAVGCFFVWVLPLTLVKEAVALVVKKRKPIACAAGGSVTLHS